MPRKSRRETAAYLMVIGEKWLCIHSRRPAPTEAARAPFVTIALTAPSQTQSGSPNRAAIVTAVICPTSPHSEKKIAAKETITALEEGYSFSASFLSAFRQIAKAMIKKLMAVIDATRRDGNLAMALPTNTATPILAMNAMVIPHKIGAARYRVARTPVV